MGFFGRFFTYSLFVSVGARAAGELPWGIQIIRSEEAWRRSQGEGARILILDSGVDGTNPDLAGQIEAIQDFYQGSAKPDSHATHIAGTLVAKHDGVGVAGVAPLAKILVARVCGGSECSPSAITKGLRWAVQQRVDVVNLSFDRDSCPSDMKKVIQEAEAAGITIVAASGNKNRGKLPCPANLPTVVSVGSVGADLKRSIWEGQSGTGGSNYGPELSLVAPGNNVLSTFPVGQGRFSLVDVVGTGEMESIQIDGSPLTSAPVHAEVLAAGLGKPADFVGKDFRGKLALVQRGGGVKFWQKAENAAKAGAVGTIVYNNEDGIYPGVLNGKQTIPIVMISKADGEKILDLLAHGAVTSDFRVEAGDYGYLSGTSMATPHVAGVVALMRSVNPNLTPARIREILQATAKPIPNDSGLNEYGAGLVNAEAAVQAAASVY